MGNLTYAEYELFILFEELALRIHLALKNIQFSYKI